MRATILRTVAVLGVATGGLAAPAIAADYTMTVAHMYPDDLSNNEVAPSMARFKQLVETGTGGAVEVEVFGAGALGSEVETAQQAQAGRVVQSTIISSGAASSFYPAYQIVTTPFLFPSYSVAWTFFDTAWFADFMQGMREQSGLHYLGTLDDGGGFVAMTNNKRLIETADDIKGLRIRVEENPAHIATMQALGAFPTPLPWGEVITALQTGLADGQFNAPGVSASFRLWEVNDYTTWTGHVYNTLTWVVSEAWFSTLPEEYRMVIVRSAREAVTMSRGIAVQMSQLGWAKSCEEFEACHVMAPEEKAKMAEIARPAFRKWITEDFGIDPAAVDALWAEVETVEADLDAQWTANYLQ
ncbi:MAG: ABC transporter substrate-binding protein [Rhodospirillaceae bacterium]|nr:ABC transporter substrate-binding protein [Rhodospirillaceae bacterium]